ncbi:MAG TPA: hypothetical protein VGM17_16320 [Rhizomicrobium sp.]|jgi:hypothetical protein
MTTAKLFYAVLINATLVCAFTGGAQGLTADTISTVSYNVAAGSCSHPIAIPANNRPVLTMGTMIMYPYDGEGIVTLFRGNTQNTIVWAGVDFAAGTQNHSSSNPGDHLMSLDSNGYVDVQTAQSTHIQVCASSSFPLPRAAGYLTFAY